MLFRGVFCSAKKCFKSFIAPFYYYYYFLGGGGGGGGGWGEGNQELQSSIYYNLFNILNVKQPF